MEGELACAKCDRRYSIIRGIPRFATLSSVSADKAATAENFGWQWQHFVQSDELYADQFLGWLAPVRPEFFQDKLVLEGGCGKGRHTQLAARWGAREVIGVDLSEAVETAFAATRALQNAHVVQADIFHLPLARVFDYAFSIGVLHHLPVQRERVPRVHRAFDELLRHDERTERTERVVVAGSRPTRLVERADDGQRLASKLGEPSQDAVQVQVRVARPWTGLGPRPAATVARSRSRAWCTSVSTATRWRTTCSGVHSPGETGTVAAARAAAATRSGQAASASSRSSRVG